MDWNKFIQNILGEEAALIPIVLPHPDPKESKILGIVLASEATAAAILTQFGVVPPSPSAPTDPKVIGGTNT